MASRAEQAPSGIIGAVTQTSRGGDRRRPVSDNTKIIGLFFGTGWAAVALLFSFFARSAPSDLGVLPVLLGVAGALAAAFATMLLFMNRARTSGWLFLASVVAVVVAGALILST